jgi:hypothetical protein
MADIGAHSSRLPVSFFFGMGLKRDLGITCGGTYEIEISAGERGENNAAGVNP